VEVTQFSETKESKTGEVECESYVHRIFRFLWDCSLQMSAARPNSQLALLLADVMGCMHKSLKKNRPESWGKKRSWMLHHGSVPAHNSLLIFQYLAKHGVTVIPQPLYSPDLAPCEFFFCFQSFNFH
jgi:hypothetical protein